MFVRLTIEIWRTGCGGTKSGGGIEWVSGGNNVGAAGFVAFVCVWVYFCCCSIGCLCQGLQGVGAV
jgi:hypothetical protein